MATIRKEKRFVFMRSFSTDMKIKAKSKELSGLPNKLNNERDNLIAMCRAIIGDLISELNWTEARARARAFVVEKYNVDESELLSDSVN